MKVLFVPHWPPTDPGVLLSGALSNKSGMNIALFTIPVALGVFFCFFIYGLNLNDLIQKKKNLENNKHNFKLNTCPQNYKKIINSDNTQCKSNNPDEMSFYLNGNNTLCSDEKKQTNGCFNEIKLKKDKCDKIKNFFSNQDILNSWHQYQTECNS